MATPAPTGKGGSSSSSRDGTGKTIVADQITQSIQSTSNLLRLMLQSSPSQAELTKLPKSLFAKTSTIKNTELVLEQLPRVISSLDAHMDNGLQSVPQLKTVMQLLSNIENCQLKTLSGAQAIQQDLCNGKVKEIGKEEGGQYILISQAHKFCKQLALNSVTRD